jgi:hypothetical protein
MKKILFVLTIFLFAASYMSAQNEAVIAAVDSTVHDFGNIKEADGPVTHVFNIKNDGKAPLVITKAVASCGCTNPVYTQEPIAPGKTSEIKVTFDPTNRPNAFIKTISVYSNGKVGSFILTIKGNVIPK